MQKVSTILKSNWKNIILLITGALAIYIVFPQIGNFNETVNYLKHAYPIWYGVAFLTSFVGYFWAVVCLFGSIHYKLPMFDSLMVQVASSFLNKITPQGLGGASLNERFLEKQGVPRSKALTAVAINSIAGIIVHLSSVFVAIFLLGDRKFENVHIHLSLGLIIVVVSICIGVLIFATYKIRKSKKNIVAAIKNSLDDLLKLIVNPKKLLMLFGGSLGITLTNALVLYFCLRSFGIHVPGADVLIVYLGAVAVGQASPTPDGLGAFEAALIAGLTAIGFSAELAIPAVLIQRLITFWIQIIPSYLAFHYVTKKGLI